MNYDQFIGQVQHRARLPSSGEAVAAVRATLQTLSERLHPGEVSDLAAQLPLEIAVYLSTGANMVERLSLQDFFDRIAFREGVDRPAAIYHARVVLEVLSEAVSPGQMEHVQAQLPPEFQPIFKGSAGELNPH